MSSSYCGSSCRVLEVLEEVLFVSTLLLTLKCESGLFVAGVSFLKRVVTDKSCPKVAIDTSLGLDYLFGFVACVISFFLSWFQLCDAALLQEVLFVFNLSFNLKSGCGLLVDVISSLKRVEINELCPEVAIDTLLGLNCLIGLLACVISLFCGVHQLVGDFLFYKVTGEVVELARWIHLSTPSHCFVSLTQGTLFSFLCFIGLGNTPHPDWSGIYAPSSHTFFISLFWARWISPFFVRTTLGGPASNQCRI